MILDPIIYFYSNVGDDINNSYIEFNGLTSGVHMIQVTDIHSQLQYHLHNLEHNPGTYSILNKNQLIYLLIDNINDNRDGTMSDDVF